MRANARSSASRESAGGRRGIRAGLLVAVAACVMNLLPVAPARACDVVTLHGSGCTQSIRCLPATVGEPCL